MNLSAESKRESFNTRIEKLDFEPSIGDWYALPDQLIHPLFSNCAVSIAVHINSVSLSQWESIDVDAKPCGSAS